MSRAAALRRGDRRALARAITLTESSRADDRRAAAALLDEILPHTGDSLRLAISGAPGVGKSTFIERFGQHLLGLGRRLAVLAVDPSSPHTGGAILGDKTRMETLARADAAFIRPSPAGASPGGVAARTRECILLCEAAGFDTIIVETVGVGQSEHRASGMVDCFALLLPPGGGDELQGIKRGVMELADILLINKADGDRQSQAEQTCTHYRQAMSLLYGSRPGRPQVLCCSALEGTALDQAWDAIQKRQQAMDTSGQTQKRRQHQQLQWFHHLLQEQLQQLITANPALTKLRNDCEQAILSGTLSPPAAATRITTAWPATSGG